MNLLQGAKKGDEGRAAKVGDGPEAGEEAAVPHFLKMALTHVLHTQRWGNSLVSTVLMWILRRVITSFASKVSLDCISGQLGFSLSSLPVSHSSGAFNYRFIVACCFCFLHWLQRSCSILLFKTLTKLWKLSKMSVLHVYRNTHQVQGYYSLYVSVWLLILFSLVL